MKKRQSFFLPSSQAVVSLVGLAIALLGYQLAFMVSKAEPVGLSNSPQERELYNTLPGSNQNDTILDATNPMDLLNRLRRATALDDATSPSDAVDQALKALESEEEIPLSKTN